MEKLAFLGRFSALYATEVTVPVALSNPDNLDDEDIDEAKTLLFRTLLSLLDLRPLVVAGIVLPVVLRTNHYCEHEVAFVSETRILIDQVAEEALKDVQKDFTVSYQLPERSPTGRSTVYLDGPEEFLEHGNIVFTFDRRKSWLRKSWKFDKDGKVELRGKDKKYFVSKIMEIVADNTSFHLAYTLRHSARLLSDRPGETLILDCLTDDSRLTSNTIAMEALDHSLPVLADLPIENVLGKLCAGV